MHHKQINTSMSVKISAPGLEDAMPGTQLLVPWLVRRIIEVKRLHNVNSCNQYDSICK